MTANRKENTVQASQTAQPGNADLAAAHKLLRSVFGFRVVPRRAGRDHRDDPRRPRRARGHADRQRQVAVLPASGAAARWAHHRGLAADRADAQPGGAAARATASPPRALNSANDFSENRDIAEQIARGELRLAYIAPERLAKPEIMAMLRTAPRSAMLAVDEAHCISQWGHDFRPEYMNSRRCATQLGSAQTVAFTATADAATRGDIVCAGCSRRRRSVFVHGFDRPNLRLAMSPRRDGRGQLLHFVARASRRQRHRLLQLAQGDRGARGVSARRRHQRAALSRRHGAGRPLAPPGHLPAGGRRGDGRDHRVRHGHRQARCALRLPRQHADHHRELLPGDRPRRPRRPCRPIR